MMRILSIHLKNIKSHRDTELTFAPGINVLSGPNGAGKSTVFEAIGYALFGVDAQKFVGNVERFVSIGAKKGEIAVTFQTAGNECFRVRRSVGPASRWLLEKENNSHFEVEEHKDAGETELRLKKLLGLDNGRPLAEQFELVIGPFQNEFLGPFVIKQATKRRDEFDAILGIDAWRKTFTATNSLAKAVRNRIEILQAEIEGRKEQVAQLPEKLEEMKSTQAELQNAANSLHDKEKDLKKIETVLAGMDNLEKAITALQKEIAALEAQEKAADQNIALRQQQVAEARKAVDIVEKTRPGKNAYEKAENHLTELRSREKQRRAVENKISTLHSQVAALQAHSNSEEKSLVEAGSELTTEEKRLDAEKKSLLADVDSLELAARLPEIKKQLSFLKDKRGQREGFRKGLQEGKEKLTEGLCPFFQEPCLNIADNKPEDVFLVRLTDLDDELRRLDADIGRLSKEEVQAEEAATKTREIRVKVSELERQKKALEGRRRKIEEHQAKLAQIRTRHQEAMTLLDKEQEVLKDFADIEKEIAAAENEKGRHRETRDNFYAHHKLAMELGRREDAFREILRQQETIRLALNGKKGDLEGCRQEYQAEKHAEERKRKETLLGLVASLRQRVSDLDLNKKRLEREIERLQQVGKEIETRNAQVHSWEDKEKLVKFLRNRVFKNVSTSLSERFREEISVRADRIYRSIAEADEELYWGENYRIVLRDMTDGEIRERTDDQLSGGQIMSAVVALRLAMLQTIGARIAFFDEPTSNLDVTRRENLARAFRAIDVGREEVTEHWYDQLFLISHDVAFSEVTDQILTLE